MRIISGLTLATFLGLALFTTADAEAGNFSHNIAIGACTRISGGALNPSWTGMFNSGTSTMNLDCASSVNMSDTEPATDITAFGAFVTDQTPGSVSCQVTIVTFNGVIMASSSNSTTANGSGQLLNFGGFGVTGNPYLSCSIPAASGGSQSGLHGFFASAHTPPL